MFIIELYMYEKEHCRYLVKGSFLYTNLILYQDSVL